MPDSAASPPGVDAPFVGAVSVFVFRGGRLLAMHRAADRDAAPGAWDAVSGRVQAGEHPFDAARRESAEETGLDVAIDPSPVTAYTAKRREADMLVVAYRAGSDGGDVVLSEEHDAFAWMTLEEFAAACPFPPLVAAARLAAGRAAAAGGGHFVLWEFRVRAGREGEFEAACGPDGDRARLFRRDPAYRGTELLRDGAGARRYVTIDRWTSRAAHDAFLARWRSEYAALDRRFEALTEHEAPLGRYDAAPAA